MPSGGYREGAGRPPKFTQAQAAEMLVKFANGVGYAALGREYDATGQCISDTIAREKARQMAAHGLQYRQEQEAML